MPQIEIAQHCFKLESVRKWACPWKRGNITLLLWRTWIPLKRSYLISSDAKTQFKAQKNPPLAFRKEEKWHELNLLCKRKLTENIQSHHNSPFQPRKPQQIGNWNAQNVTAVRADAGGCTVPLFPRASLLLSRPLSREMVWGGFARVVKNPQVDLRLLPSHNQDSQQQPAPYKTSSTAFKNLLPHTPTGSVWNKNCSNTHWCTLTHRRKLSRLLLHSALCHARSRQTGGWRNDGRVNGTISQPSSPAAQQASVDGKRRSSAERG